MLIGSKNRLCSSFNGIKYVGYFGFNNRRKSYLFPILNKLHAQLQLSFSCYNHINWNTKLSFNLLEFLGSHPSRFLSIACRSQRQEQVCIGFPSQLKCCRVSKRRGAITFWTRTYKSCHNCSSLSQSCVPVNTSDRTRNTCVSLVE